LADGFAWHDGSILTTQDNVGASCALASLHSGHLRRKPMRIFGALATGVVVTTLGFGLITTTAAAQQLRGTPGAPNAVEFPNSRVLPTPQGAFQGTIMPSARESTPA
jgi:hypothetical protein